MLNTQHGLLIGLWAGAELVWNRHPMSGSASMHACLRVASVGRAPWPSRFVQRHTATSGTLRRETAAVQCGLLSWGCPDTHCRSLAGWRGPPSATRRRHVSHAVGCRRAQVAQFKATVLLLPNGSDRVTSAPVQPWESEKKVEDDEVLKLLATSLKKSKSSKKTAKKKARNAIYWQSRWYLSARACA